MGERIGSAQTRELGEELRKYREAVGLSGHELARRLGWSASKVSRIEAGVTGVDEIDVVRYAAHCQVPAGDIDELLELCREPGTQGYWLSKRLSTLTLHENTASSSVNYDPLVVPGLLQTQEYAAELIGAEGLPQTVAGHRIAARMERQRVLHSRPFTFFVHEQALRLPVGGGRLMNEQLLKLALLAEQPRIAIRVIPAALGARSVFEGEFMLFQYAAHHPVIYLPSAGLYLEDRDKVARYQEKVCKLSGTALDRGQSRSKLAALASELDRPEDPPDAPPTAWRKSSFSSASDDACVEVAFAPSAVAVRDSKNTTGPTLTFDPRGWRSFVSVTGEA